MSYFQGDLNQLFYSTISFDIRHSTFDIRHSTFTTIAINIMHINYNKQLLLIISEPFEYLFFFHSSSILTSSFLEQNPKELTLRYP